MRTRVAKSGDKDLKAGGEKGYAASDRRSHVKVSQTITHFRPYTPSADLIPEGPCDAILIGTAAATVTGTSADDPAMSVATMPYVAAEWHHVSYSKITAVSAGTIWIGWYRKPNP